MLGRGSAALLTIGFLALLALGIGLLRPDVPILSFVASFGLSRQARIALGSSVLGGLVVALAVFVLEISIERRIRARERRRSDQQRKNLELLVTQHLGNEFVDLAIEANELLNGPGADFTQQDLDRLYEPNGMLELSSELIEIASEQAPPIDLANTAKDTSLNYYAVLDARSDLLIPLLAERSNPELVRTLLEQIDGRRELRDVPTGRIRQPADATRALQRTSSILRRHAMILLAFEAATSDPSS